MVVGGKILLRQPNNQDYSFLQPKYIQSDLESFNNQLGKEQIKTNYLIAIFLVIQLVIITLVITTLAIFKRKSKNKSQGHKMPDERPINDKLFSIIAHDLKNPFLTLVGYSDLLIKDFNQLDKKEIEFFINEINTVSKKTLNLVENLLSWALVQKDEMNLQKESLNLSQVVQETVKNLSNMVKPKCIDLQTNIENSINVYFDKFALFTVLRNLIHNAVKFTPEGGKIIVNCEKKGNKIHLSVQDTGIGMNEETKVKLFEKEINFSSKGTQNEQGTGLGLVICRDLMRKGDEKIWVESKPGQGTKFTITLQHKNKL